MEQLSFDERFLMKGLFYGELDSIALSAGVSVPQLRNVLNGWVCHSELLLKILRDRVEVARLAHDHLEAAKLNVEELFSA